MSVVVQYVRLSPEQVERLAEKPEELWTLGRRQGGRRQHCPGAEVLDLDKAYEPIAWLLSPLKRLEVDHLDRLIRIRDEPDQVVRERVRIIAATPVDAVLEAVEGRGAARDERFDIGLGAPCSLSAEKVRALGAALGRISHADLQRGFDADEMERVDLSPAGWRDEGRAIMQAYVLPSFDRLQAFYRAAAAGNQVAMILFS